jgi:hypothetical protein
MKPDWDKLMETYKGHKTILVGDVDCTAAGKPLCDSNGVKGFPTIKHGDASNLEDYNGGRDYKSLNDFASKLKPACSPANMDLCDDEGRAAIEKIQGMSDEELDAAIAAADKKAADAEELFKTELDKLQKAYQKLQDNKEATLQEVKDSGVGLKKAVKAARGKGGDKKEL